MTVSRSKEFWTSLPGVLTGFAAVITALTGAWIAFSGGKSDGADRHAVADVPAKAVAPAEGGRAKPLRISVGANWLGPKLGGRLVFASDRNWDRMIDGDEEQAVQIGERAGDYGIFGFRDGRRARISAFTMIVPAASGMNPTAVELSYAAASEDGPFVPLGVFAVRNGRVPPDGRQEFRFPSTEMRFLKVALKESQSGGPYIMAYEFGVLGELLEN